jgi:hypothetical protein
MPAPMQPPPEAGVVDEEPKPLGAYRCGGRCSPEGIIGNIYDGVACSKCRVFAVAHGDRYISASPDRRYVRARNAREAVAIYAKLFPEATLFGVNRHNTLRGKHSLTLCFRREGAGLTRVLSRRTPEQLERDLHYRMAATLRIAAESWKIPEGRVAGIVKQRLAAFMKERNLVFPKK